MNEDLRFLAESVHEWDGRFDMVCRSALSFPCSPEWFNSKYFNGKHGYTRAQWQAARDELSGKPLVSEWPEWVQWIAQWSDGQWLGYEIEPVRGDIDDPDDCYVDPRETPRIHYFGYGQILGDWRNTLEQRPDAEARQWRGPEDVLHPVGTEVEYPSGRGVVMLKPDSNGVLITLEDGEYKRVAACACKPLHTEEYKAVEEMREIIVETYRNSIGSEPSELPHSDSLDVYLREIYRAGYRKQESE